MKNQTRKDRKLALNKDTVRALDQVDLAKAAGGDITSTTHLTRIAC